MKFKNLPLVIFTLSTGFLLGTFNSAISNDKHPTVDTIYIKEGIRFDTMQINTLNMYKVCDSIGIKYPRIVISQAILESGHFKSDVFRKYNNPLGLYDSKNKRYFRFNHWSDAIIAYQNMVEYKHKDDENYYDFLNRIGYAEDKEYTNKVRKIENNLSL